MDWGESQAGRPADKEIHDILRSKHESQSSLGSPAISEEYGGFADYDDDDNNNLTSEARNCPHCAVVRANVPAPYQLPLRDCQQIFHSACALCDDDATADVQDDQRLCAFCRHLRLRHMVLCLRKHGETQLIHYNAVSLGLTREVVQRAVRESSCPSCRFWGALAARLLPDFPNQPFVIGNHEFSVHFLSASIFLDDNYCMEAEIDVNIRSLPTSSPGGRNAPLQEDHHTPPPRRIDWDRPAEWVHACCQGHGRCSPKEARDLPAQFRLIDVKERKLVRPPTLPCRYVAMSYVWGTPKKPMATRSNIKSLEEPGSLQRSVVPQTVMDAMTVCEKLSQRYLWADCLCIVQDDPEDKLNQIRRMAGIYTAAEVVLVIASGSCMDEAVSGVSADRPERIQGDFLGLRFTQTHFRDPWEILQSTTWATRGWTYQEGILPSRNLYIMDQEVWFECGESVIREDPYAEQVEYIKEGSKLARTRVSRWLGALHLPDRDGSDRQPPWDSYTWHLPRYTKRSLSDDGDIFNAFSGILSPLFDDHGGTTFGIPLAEFDRALLWANVDNDTTAGLRPGVPSWSWGSMRGHTIADGLNDIETLVRWSQYSESEEAIVERTVHRDQWPGGPGIGFLKNSTCLAIAWAHGLVEKPCPRELDHRSVSFDELNQVATERWHSPRDFLREALDKVELDQYASLDVRRANVLCSRAQTSVLKIMRGDFEYCERSKWKRWHGTIFG